MKSFVKYSSLLAAGLVTTGVLLGVGTESASALSVFRSGQNDCPGEFSGLQGGFSSCNIGNPFGENISPSIIKFEVVEVNGMDVIDKTNPEINSLYPTINGSEFNFSNIVYDDDEIISLDWFYTSGTGDPSVRFVSFKAGNGYVLKSNAACNVFTASCLNTSTPITSGAWNANDGNGAALSHIVFYNDEGIIEPPPTNPNPIPEPSSLLGLFVISGLGCLSQKSKQLFGK